jgi:energy-coupling factor transporter transmembrane protein EcfT
MQAVLIKPDDRKGRRTTALIKRQVVREGSLDEAEKRFLHKLYPFTKLLYVGVAGILAVLTPHWSYLYFMFLFLCVLAVTGACLKSFLKKIAKSVGTLFVLIFLLQSLFRPGTDIIARFWIFSVKREGILYALRLCGILLEIASSFVLFFETTRLQDMTLAMEKAGASPTVSYVVLSTMQMIPQTKRRSEIIMNAQMSRGIETKGSLKVRMKAFFPMVGPLILSSFSAMEERALTLEARGFSARGKKSHLRDIVDTRLDKILRIVMLAVFILAVIGRILVCLL